ncbi:Protein of unknown function, DUF481 [Pricia antarctica]|uniref:Salt-induced outer membrane protein YdiY n=1 Tax=Pricia antarctica TaxID=641691 RepID=A0A1G7BXK8_9FLAO|nr:DUF481 domain-containing protein [Pricia antarctica]SDE31763.1 Protein of unknown function, DUF481 [Pricia antarctica]
MFSSKKKFLSLLFCSFYAITNAQLVNIESKRMQKDSVRFALKSDVLFDYTDNNGDYIIEIGTNLTTQLKSKDLKKILFFIGNYDLIRSKEQDFQNSWFFHLRYNQKLSNLFRLEGFLQNQNNTLLTITSRNLIGAGVRLKVVSTESTKLYLGNAYMYEIEKNDATNERFFNHRNSSYLSLSHAFEKIKLDLTGTVYFQPLYDDIGNHRILNQIKAELPISKIVSLSALYNYFYSSFSTTTAIDRSSKLSVGLTFGI